MPASHTRLRPWLELLRLPNLPTVPGDPLAGAMLAATATAATVSLRQAAGAAAASLCLYMAGLVLNDLHDLPEDRARRPERPLARGAIAVARARLAFGVLAVLGLAAAAWAGGLLRGGAAGAAVLGLVCLYDLAAKARPPSACLVMGLCRGTSMLLGACVVGAPGAAVFPAAALTTYIGAVTWLSRREDEVQRPGAVMVLLPPLAMAAGCLAVGLSRPPVCHLGLTAFVASAVLAAGAALRLSLSLLRRDVGPQQARAAVGQYIGLLLPWQAAVVLSAGTPGATLTAMALLAAWPISRGMARRVSGS